MTTISYRHDDDHVLIELKGHADYNPGNDIVCAAVSTVTYGIINYLDSLEVRGKIKNYYARENPGDFKIEFDLTDFDEYNEIEYLLKTYYEMISECYPENVCFF